jgi:hypothetical protein
MRPRSAGQCLFFIAATVSTTVIYALERANNDVVIFLLMVCGGVLLAGSRLLRLAAYMVFLLGGLLKFYPLALLMLAMRERWRTACAVVAIFGIAVLGLWWLYDREITMVLGNLPQVSYYADSISARNLPLGLARLFPPTTLISAEFLGVVIFLILFVYAMILAVKIFRALESDGRSLEGWPPETAFLLIGAILLTGCFFTAENISYRGIFLLLVVPGLVNFRDRAAAPGIRRLFGFALAIILVLMWEQRLGLALKYAFADSINPIVTIIAWVSAAIYWVSRELAWWGLISFFIALIVALLSRLPLAVEFAHLLGKRNSSQATGVWVRRGE